MGASGNQSGTRAGRSAQPEFHVQPWPQRPLPVPSAAISLFAMVRNVTVKGVEFW
jgi:hypothetical protein